MFVFRLGLGAEFDSASNGTLFEGGCRAKTGEKSQHILFFIDFGTINRLQIRSEAWIEFRIKFCVD
jgi:hypothetical protein